MYDNGTHEIVNDNKKELSVDYYAGDSVISTAIPEGQDFSGDTIASALVKIVGKERAMKLLGWDDSNNPQLQAALDLARRQGNRTFDLGDPNFANIAGEFLMQLPSITAFDGTVRGNILAEVNENGYFNYSYVNATVYRNPLSHYVLANVGTRQRQYENLDTIVYYKVGINYNFSDVLVMGNYQTVDNTTQSGMNEPYYSPRHGGWVQGNTVAAGVFNMQYYSKSHFTENVLVINNARTISGIFINSLGLEGDATSGPRWLEHDNWIQGKNDPGNVKLSDGCFITTVENQGIVLAKLAEFGLTRGYQIKTTLHDKKYVVAPKYNGYWR
ncbi:MAG: hypothetical protein LBI67_00575, partial [Treponema sp.]|jgi:hypothetical protein|nr:hypothetical protein [Treponema sp.]